MTSSLTPGSPRSTRWWRRRRSQIRPDEGRQVNVTVARRRRGPPVHEGRPVLARPPARPTTLTERRWPGAFVDADVAAGVRRSSPANRGRWRSAKLVAMQTRRAERAPAAADAADRRDHCVSAAPPRGQMPPARRRPAGGRRQGGRRGLDSSAGSSTTSANIANRAAGARAAQGLAVRARPAGGGGDHHHRRSTSAADRPRRLASARIRSSRLPARVARARAPRWPLDPGGVLPGAGRDRARPAQPATLHLEIDSPTTRRILA